MESSHSATTSNPPRNFKEAPLDPYSWGGIARSSGGRDTRTTYGAMSAGGNDGVNEVYLPGAARPPVSGDTSKIYLVPDPRTQNKAGQYVASRYLDNDGNDIVAKPGVINANPPRAGAVKKQPKAPAQGE